ncbi:MULTISPECIES: DNA polymerase V [unclassified Citrobacter]|uniref:DNA polymerase V n=1 Tax=unclassified Citrobacter TaxID=2644389 RepID=UPI0015E9B058|nr:DNA polymerase V [Citrobacter sp. RHBSTW-00104]QLR62048.1 DNA polymerase V [Citrobacter sp. RHBSTW-00976]QLW54528.1 DNA polymerase V [Citrobacter sp. RHBSTW-00628]QLW59416.1 DNA polymerase V [Citrobacter sp. RHBSTW-00667]QLZ25384.1 DNA polymerase V [Citrobacter sp. RHBSTW-00137]QMA27113.1 DNA polymerase V [Citrobacter sp. RHBSTW-00021]
MPRKSDIHSAFVAAIQLNPKGYQCLRTDDFIRELRARNWHFSQKDANEWIEWYVTTFRDVSTQEGENRTFQLFNPNGGL